MAVGTGGPLPKWVREEVVRSTPKERREPALIELQKGLDAFADDRYDRAAGALGRAKALAPRSATIRELLGLSLYHTDRWEESLRELRTFRRLTGESTHMPVELDCLRALGRAEAIHKTWELFVELGGQRETEDEARVVYASFLIDSGDPVGAWKVIKPGRLIANAPESTLRRWAVAARVAKAAGDLEAARKLVSAIEEQAPDLPWLPELEGLLD